VLCAELYDRPGSPYADADGREHPDNDLRFARLSLAAAEIAELGVGGWKPDVTHLNDWPTALAAGYLKWRGSSARTVLTLHNLAHQGVFPAGRREALAIPAAAFTLEGVEFYGGLSFLKAGLNCADEITTVSETYAEEIVRPEYGCGLEGLIAKRRAEGRLTGILNGIEPGWDPRADKSCPTCSIRSAGRAVTPTISAASSGSRCRARRCSPSSRGSRIRRASDLVLEFAETIVERGAQLVLIGRGDRHAETRAVELAARFPEAIGVRIGFRPAEARAAFAAADFLLMPSRYEPCGLSQMFAQRFGALPLAHRTGGLAETIDDGATGFLFDGADAEGLEGALDRAFEVYARLREFHAMRRAAMAKRFDWDESAAKYAAIYRRLAAAR